jgi:hypothetical protein
LWRGRALASAARSATTSRICCAARQGRKECQTALPDASENAPKLRPNCDASEGVKELRRGWNPPSQRWLRRDKPRPPFVKTFCYLPVLGGPGSTPAVFRQFFHTSSVTQVGAREKRKRTWRRSARELPAPSCRDWLCPGNSGSLSPRCLSMANGEER